MKKDNKYTKELEELKENIKKIRKEKGYRSAESFAEALGVSLKTVQGWENLDNGRWPDLVMMLKVCDLTETDIDYLLDRIKEPTHDIKFIHEKTGLSVEAIKKLMGLKGTGLDEILSNMLEHNETDKLFSSIRMAVDKIEMWWAGLLQFYPKDGTMDDYEEISDFLASKRFLRIVDDIRKNYEDAHGGLYSLGLLPAKELNRRKIYSSIIERCDNESELEEALKKYSEDERELITGMWHRFNTGEEDIDTLSFAEWMKKYGKEIKNDGEY